MFIKKLILEPNHDTTKEEVISMKSERGATLIALVIITVILLIIAGIAIHLAVKSVNEDIDVGEKSVSEKLEESENDFEQKNVEITDDSLNVIEN